MLFFFGGDTAGASVNDYNGVGLDGLSYLTRPAAFSDPLQFTLACGFMYESGDVGNKILFQSGGFYDEDSIQWPGVQVGLTVVDTGDSFSDFGVRAIGYNTDGLTATQILDVYTGTGVGIEKTLVRDVWYGLYLSSYFDDVSGLSRMTVIELDGAGTLFSTYVNISSGGTNLVTSTGYDSWGAALTDYTSVSSGSQMMFGRMFRPWITTDTYDLSATAYQKFFTSGGYPVDLGSNGSTPFSAQPQDYLKNPAASFGTNSGSAGNYTAQGTFTTATPPAES